MSAHTPGPWRWEINRNGKDINLVGGVPKFDLTVMDFTRWGMDGATARFRDTAHDGVNLMDRVCDKPEWIADFPGRSHHAHWCASVIHPDARLIAAAPDLLDALREIEAGTYDKWTNGYHAQQVARAAIAKATDQ